MRRLIGGPLLVLAVALASCEQAPALIVTGNGIVTTRSGAAYGGELVGPVTLESSVVAGVTCFWARDSNGLRHGVIWPYGTIARDGGIRIPGFGPTILPGTAFWSGGGTGTTAGVPELGGCDAPPDYWLGGQFSLSNPVPSGG